MRPLIAAFRETASRCGDPRIGYRSCSRALSSKICWFPYLDRFDPVSIQVIDFSHLSRAQSLSLRPCFENRIMPVWNRTSENRIEWICGSIPLKAVNGNHQSRYALKSDCRILGTNRIRWKIRYYRHFQTNSYQWEPILNKRQIYPRLASTIVTQAFER